MHGILPLCADSNVVSIPLQSGEDPLFQFVSARLKCYMIQNGFDKNHCSVDSIVPLGVDGLGA